MGVMVDKSMIVLYDYKYGIPQVKNDSGPWYPPNPPETGSMADAAS